MNSLNENNFLTVVQKLLNQVAEIDKAKAGNGEQTTRSWMFYFNDVWKATNGDAITFFSITISVYACSAFWN